MIECIFTLDYEIYGNGQGGLKELVYEPAEELRKIFLSANARFVVFVEVMELMAIDTFKTDAAINLVKKQICQFRGEGFEMGLHLHPQWQNAHRKKDAWVLDDSEYNLCSLPPERMDWMIQQAIDYLSKVLSDPSFTPLSFRAGNWLLQPTQPAAGMLAGNGIKVDSSVFKGGLQRDRGLDYRPALKNGFYWRFHDDVNVKDDNGDLLEMPTHTRLVPFWQMLTRKRLSAQWKSHDKSCRSQNNAHSLRQKVIRFGDLFRFRYPLKFDFCRMTYDELRDTVERVWQDNQNASEKLIPLVAIGHTKDFDDPDTVMKFLAYLHAKGIRITTFEQIYQRCRSAKTRQLQPV